VISLVVVTDGRGEYLAQLAATLHRLDWTQISQTIVVDDSGHPPFAALLDRNFPSWEIHHHPQRLGLAATVRHAWTLARNNWLFHLEEDFTLDRNVPLRQMRETLEAVPMLAQLCLVRQPWSPTEMARGGIPQWLDGAQEHVGAYRFVAHRGLFSLNPCLVPRVVFGRGWPDGNEAEFSAGLVRDQWWFGYWGGKDDPPAVTHTGAKRSAGWKL